MPAGPAIALRCLIAVDEIAIRDSIAEAGIAFDAIEIDALPLEEGRERLRRRKYDLAFVSLKSASRESSQLLEEIRSVSKDVVLVGITPKSAVESKRIERSEHNLFALLGTPLDTVDLFATLRRAIDRITKSRVGGA